MNKSTFRTLLCCYYYYAINGILLLEVVIMIVIRTTVIIIIIILYFINVHPYYLPFTYCKFAFISISGDDLYKIFFSYQILYHITLCDIYM